MRTATVNKNTVQQTKASTPFFNKNPESNFFSLSKEQIPFFSSLAIQSKPDTLTEGVTIVHPESTYEQEADSIAQKVIQHIESANTPAAIQPKCDSCEEEILEKEEASIQKSAYDNLPSTKNHFENTLQMLFLKNLMTQNTLKILT